MQDERRRSRRLAVALALLAGGAFTTLAWLRFAAFHNGNFDLGFYVRMAWGLARGDPWEPLVGAHVLGLHLSPVTNFLGLVGRATSLPLPGLLLCAQGFAVALAAWPLAKIGERHLGPWGALIGAATWLCHPNLGHVASYDFHPGTVAVLPLAWACESVDARRPWRYGLALAGVVLCREDLVLPGALLGGLLAASLWRAGRRARSGPAERSSETPRRVPPWIAPLSIAALGISYLAMWALWLHPSHAPPVGSLELHFGRLGSSPWQVAVHLLTHPSDVVREVAREGRYLQIPLLLAPLAFVPLLAPRWWIPAAPVLLLNMLSAWPNTQGLYTHYATPVLPMLVAAALVGAGKLRCRLAAQPRRGQLLAALPAIAAACGHALVGGTPASVFWDKAAVRDDEVSRDARAILERVPADASVQAPDALVAHLAERPIVHRGPPPEWRTDLVVVDVRHRVRLLRRGDLLRSVEEPEVRKLLFRWSLLAARPRFLLLDRRHTPRDGLGRRYLTRAFASAELPAPVRLTGCLSLVAAAAIGHDSERARLGLGFRAHGPCAADLAIRLSRALPFERIDPGTVVNDLLFDGLLSPAVLRDGDAAWSVHDPVGPTVAQAIREGVVLGLVRESGARPEPADPTWVAVPVRRAREPLPRGAATSADRAP